MIPYSSFLFFYFTIILLAPSIILRLLNRRPFLYDLLATLIAMVLIYSYSKSVLFSLILFMVWQVGLIYLYKNLRTMKNYSWVFYLFIVLSILPLLLVKLNPYLKLNSTIGFLGISYLTFKGLQILIEIRDGIIKKNISLHLLLYFFLFFPTISSGPIDRFRRFEKDFYEKKPREEYLNLITSGFHKIIIGFFYKFILAYLINEYLLTNSFIIENHSFVQRLLYMYSYSMYLFFDFAGYSAFAIGISYLLGIKTPENFNMPFISRNIKDFWNRWHMTLSFWFRDYVYMRFVFLMTKKKWLKNKYLISYLGYFTLFFLMGVWHGLENHYILYGLYHAFLIISFDIFERLNKKYKFWPNNKLTHVMSIIITFHAICFGFYIFSGHLI
jgi:membrane protein involved in D-alanine export